MVTPEASGLGEMIADIVRSNIAAHPQRAGLLDGVRGRVNVIATDAGVATGLLFTGSGLSVGSAFDRAEVTIETDSETLLQMTSVPLRFGNPDPTTAEGRDVLRKIATRKLRIRGLVHQKLIGRMQRLLTVA